MQDAPASPKAGRLASPSWLDTRLLLGVLLVLVSVVVGARVLASADRTQPVWVATQDLASGTTLTEDHLVREEVRLTDTQTALLLRAPEGDNVYLGKVLQRPVGEGELVPLRALREAAERDERQFTLNVAVGHLPPDLDDGQVVDVYVTPSRDAAAAADAGPGAGASPGPALSPTGSRLVLSGVTVDAVERGEGGLGGASDSVPVVLVLARDDVLEMVTAVAQGQIDLVRVRGASTGSLAARSAPSPAPSAAAG